MIVNAMIIAAGGGASGKLVFDYSGAAVTVTVPPLVSKMKIKAWGAGGGGTNQGGGYNDYGGAGVYIEGWFAVTPGETLLVVVGEGGRKGGPRTFGGGGKAGSVGALNASGGGLTGVFRGTVDLAHAIAIAAGGGGAANNINEAWSAGEGGDAAGADARNNGYPQYGRGGTQTEGGYGANVGEALQGGDGLTATGGGGGGGGKYGGGGGGGGASEAAGGGGSSYRAGLTDGLAITSANHYSPPNTADADYAAGIAAGGLVDQAGHGRAVLIW